MSDVSADPVDVTLRQKLLRVGLPTIALLSVSACAGGPDTDGQVASSIEVWAHDGTPAEREVLEQQVSSFNNSQDEVTVTLRLVSEGDYGDVLQSAVAKGELPDVAEVDGPRIAAYAYQDALVPLDGLLPDSVLSGQLPSLRAQGSYAGHTYAVGTFDSGLGLYADRRALRAAGVTWPQSLDEAWTAREFGQVLTRLAREDADGKVLDVKLNYGVGEWLTYGFAPLVASAGGELIDGQTLSPEGHLDGPAAGKALDTLRSWAPYLDPNKDDDAFVTRKAPLSWVGHWVYRDYAAALGDDLLVLPLPDLGHGPKTGQGSWAWSITAADEAKQRAASQFVQYLLNDEEVLRMTEANGAVPGMSSALAASELYADGGPLHLFAEQLLLSCRDQAPTRECVAVPRPVTPGYAVLTSQFAEAVAVALAGEDAAGALDDAAAFIASDLEANGGFR